jgi:KaiC/GvpD/RAD55 family RecA-like ATPase/transcriptional regulator with XRE-family HTH domain
MITMRLLALRAKGRGLFRERPFMRDPLDNEAAPPTLREAIKQELRSRGWSQKKFASFIEKDESTVSLWLSGRHGPRADDEEIVRKLAEFLHTKAAKVEQLLAVRRKRKEIQAGPEGLKRVNTKSQLRREVEGRFASRMEELLPLNTYTAPEGVEQRLLEKGILAASDVVEGVIADECGRKDRRHPEELCTRISAHPEEGARPIRDAYVRSKDPEFALKQFKKHRRGGDDNILEAFQMTFRQDERIRDGIRHMLRRVSSEFEKKGEELRLKQLRGCMSEALREGAVLPGDYRRAPADIATAVLQRLLELRLLETMEKKTLGRRWQLNPEYVINSLFGLDSKIHGLNFLLDGGLILPSASGMTMLIKGQAGTGKTMLALQLAASLALQGHVSVYLSGEENPNLLMERLSYIGYTRWLANPPYKKILCRREREGERKFEAIICNVIEPLKFTESEEGAAQFGKDQPDGKLLLVAIPNRNEFYRPDNPLLRKLHEFLRSFPDRYACCVLDSVDAVSPNGGRRLQEEMLNFVKDQRGIGIFTSEMHGQEASSAFRDYLVDMVIRVGYRSRSHFRMRILEIEKCRTQSHIRGEHIFSIQSGEGIAVYPSVQSLLSVWRRRVRRERSVDRESWKLDEELDLDRILKGDMVRGSANLLTGPPASHKFPLGLSFLASGLESRRDKDVLLISLREDETSILRIAQTYPQFKALLERPKSSKRLSSRLRVLHFPPDYYTAERFIDSVRAVLREYKVKERQFSRVFFSNLSQLRYNSPMFGEEGLFIAALSELFRKEQITSLFIDVGGSMGTEIQDIFDTIIFTELDAGQVDRIRIRIGHSGPCNAVRTPNVLDRITEKNGYGRLVLTDKQPSQLSSTP